MNYIFLDADIRLKSLCIAQVNKVLKMVVRSAACEAGDGLELCLKPSVTSWLHFVVHVWGRSKSGVIVVGWHDFDCT